MLIEISKIKVSDRIRKDYGDIEDLAKDIGANGLINPIVVTPDFALIAGERRLRAHQFLGYLDVDVNVMTVRDYEHQLQIEISENEHRKEFTYSERVDWGKRLEQVEKLKAKERMSGKDDESSSGQVRDIVAEKIGLGSGKNFDKAKFIIENATPEIVQLIDAGAISTHKAFIETRQRLEKEAREEKERADQAERDLVAMKKQYKDAIPSYQLEEAISAAVSKQQEETGIYLSQKERDLELILTQRDKEHKKKLEEIEASGEQISDQLRKGYERVKGELEALRLNQPTDFDEKQQEIVKKKLQYEADINTIQLRVQIKGFLEKAAISSLLIGSIAQTDSSEKMRLTASLEMLESFTAQIKAALSGRKVVEKHVK